MKELAIVLGLALSVAGDPFFNFNTGVGGGLSASPTDPFNPFAGFNSIFDSTNNFMKNFAGSFANAMSGFNNMFSGLNNMANAGLNAASNIPNPTTNFGAGLPGFQFNFGNVPLNSKTVSVSGDKNGMKFNAVGSMSSFSTGFSTQPKLDNANTNVAAGLDTKVESSANTNAAANVDATAGSVNAAANEITAKVATPVDASATASVSTS